MMLGSVIIFMAIATVSCRNDIAGQDDVIYGTILEVAGDGTTSINEANLKSALLEVPSISDEELTILIHMKEEEKLAHDVYTALYQKWGSRIFLNISAAENNHMNAVILLLETYSFDNAAIGEAGRFDLEEIQTLYNDLVAKGSVSVEEAYKVGALIEEMDIADLEEAIAAVSNENIILVFENLLKGSRNHLRAFDRQLTRLNIEYTPVYIGQEVYDQIVSTPFETGGIYPLNGNRKQNRQRGNGPRGQGIG